MDCVLGIVQMFAGIWKKLCCFRAGFEMDDGETGMALLILLMLLAPLLAVLALLLDVFEETF